MPKVTTPKKAKYGYKQPKGVLYTLKRYGEFFTTVCGPSHCSMAHSGARIRLEYRLIIQCLKLDEQKFVYEQEKLAGYFYTIRCTDLSCEALAEKAARDIHISVSAIIQSNNLTVEVSISPPPYVGSAAAKVGSIGRG